MLLPVTAGDIQDAILPLLQENPLLTSMFPSLPTALHPAVPDIPSALPALLDDDPLTVDQNGGVAIALVDLAEDDAEGSLGGSSAGTREVEFYFALVIYVWGANRDHSKKRFLEQLTSQARAALMQDGLRRDPSPVPRQRWYGAYFYKKPCTVYKNGGGFRQSITFIKYNSRFRTL